MPPRSASQTANARRREAAIRRTAESRARNALEAIARNMRRQQTAARSVSRNAAQNAAGFARTLAGQVQQRRIAARTAIVQRRRAQGVINRNITHLKSIIGQFNNFASLEAAIQRHRLHNNPYGYGVSNPIPINVANRVGRWYLQKEQHNQAMQHALEVQRQANAAAAQARAVSAQAGRVLNTLRRGQR